MVGTAHQLPPLLLPALALLATAAPTARQVCLLLSTSLFLSSSHPGLFSLFSAANPCLPNPCQNGGSCDSTSPLAYTCACATGFSGTTCLTVDFCVSQPCENGGTCTSSSTGYTCACDSGFSGQQCGTGKILVFFSSVWQTLTTK